MKILYLSCHAILEYDELKLFEEMGIEYFSLGSYINPLQPVDPIRPALTQKPDEWAYKHAPDRNNLPVEFLDKFDLIIVMHVKEWIINNWEKLRGRNVIWRTIGQSIPSYEQDLFAYRQQGLKVVRYSEREVYIDNNIGCDTIIPFYKDPNEFGMWNGQQHEAMALNQDMKNRAEFCNYDAFVEIAKGLPVKLYGTKNEASGDLSGGYLSYDDMKQKMRDCRAYIYTGTQPASYTLNFIEAMMTGIPVVALGAKHGNSLKLAGEVYEIPYIIQNGVNGFVSDDIEVLRNYIRTLMTDEKTAARIGHMGRQTAIERFGKEVIKLKWQKLFNKYGHNQTTAGA